MEGVSQFLQELRSGKRLLQKRVFTDGVGGAVDFFGVAGDEDDFDVREFLLNLTGEFGAAHAWHDDVRDENLNGAIKAFGNFEGFDAVSGGEDLIAGGLQEFAREGADGIFVFGDEDGFAATGLRRG